ncbi:MAG: ABC transporter ATP-binding protein [Pseudomonadales bacterium]|nr:ABC transporter ATP-binding protein [Pseudomonadales bacterium]
MTKLLEVKDLSTHLHLKRGILKAVNGVTFDLNAGETLGLIGESGSGKTMTGLSLLGLLPRPAGRVVGGSIKLEGQDLVGLSDETMAQKIRGKKIAMISQDPMTSLNPVFSIGYQVAAPLREHGMATGTDAHRMAIEELKRVHVPAPEDRAREYPHQFSGGMRQRAVAAMAISCRPQVLIADEPTSALDVTIQLQFMSLLEEIQRNTGAAVLFITHDLGVAASLCDRVAVMYAGRVVETADVTSLYSKPKHPYTQGLLESVPRLGSKKKRLVSISGSPPDPLKPPSGCSFHPRCKKATVQCRSTIPPEKNLGNGHRVLCWLPDD